MKGRYFSIFKLVCVNFVGFFGHGKIVGQNLDDSFHPKEERLNLFLVLNKKGNENPAEGFHIEFANAPRGILQHPIPVISV